jgi:hypothetical protein
MANEHPYDDYEGTALWRQIDAAVRDLVDNGDLLEQTDRRYIVGYITKQLSDASKQHQPENLKVTKNDPDAA